MKGYRMKRVSILILMMMLLTPLGCRVKLPYAVETAATAALETTAEPDMPTPETIMPTPAPEEYTPKPVEPSTTPSKTPITTPTLPPVKKETEHMRFDAAYIDRSYVGKYGNQKLLIFFTVTANNSDMYADSSDIQIVIEGNRFYEAKFLGQSAFELHYTRNYLYTGFSIHMLSGTQQSFVATFLIPEKDLVPGKAISISHNSLSKFEKLLFYTDDILYYEDGIELAQTIDPDGYDDFLRLTEKADAQTAETVARVLSVLEYSFSIDGKRYSMGFTLKNHTPCFSVKPHGQYTRQGEYEVLKGYLSCTYSDNGYSFLVPYTLEPDGPDKDTDIDINVQSYLVFDIDG